VAIINQPAPVPAEASEEAFSCPVILPIEEWSEEEEEDEEEEDEEQ